jgi:hypothetical protein
MLRYHVYDGLMLRRLRRHRVMWNVPARITSHALRRLYVWFCLHSLDRRAVYTYAMQYARDSYRAIGEAALAVRAMRDQVAADVNACVTRLRKAPQ